jgi:hypothetical protein
VTANRDDYGSSAEIYVTPPQSCLKPLSWRPQLMHLQF